MTISIPTSQVLVATNVIDPTSTFNPAINMSYPTGFRIQKDGWIWENKGVSITPTTYVLADEGTYTEGQILYKDGKLQRWHLTGERLSQPEEYTTVDNGEYSLGNLFKANTWTHKYVKLGSTPQDQTLYDPDFIGDQVDASKYLAHTWVDSEGKTQIELQVTPETALGEGSYSTRAPSVVTELTADTVEVKASLHVTDNKLIGTLGTLFVRGNDLYMRTSFDANTEYTTISNPYGEDITSVDNLDGFEIVERATYAYPFDGRNYTVSSKDNTMTYTIKGLQSFDTIALGRVKGTSASILFKDSLGVTVSTHNFTIDGSRDSSGNLDDWHTTLIKYAISDTTGLPVVMEANSTVEITITGGRIELGTLLLGISVDAGFSNLAISNRYKDFSILSENSFGFIDYVEREKISIYKGSVDIRVTDYDRIDRLMTSLGGKINIVNGSKSKTKVPDSKSVFASTQKIGRLFDFETKTQISEDDIDPIATYTFRFEEIV